jgi:hypothetical protein
MHLLIDIDRDPKTGWKGYDYEVNGRVLDGSTTTIKRLPGGHASSVRYFKAGQELVIFVPRASLGLKGSHRVEFDFHWTDNRDAGSGDVADWWYFGDSAPDGRFNYAYRNDDSICVDVKRDPDNCGVCGHTCSEDQTCKNGHCQAPTTEADCFSPKHYCDSPRGCTLGPCH